MRKVSIFLLLLFALDCSAQEKALAKIQYNFFHVNDTNHRDQPLRDEVVTYLGKTSSFYTTYTDVVLKEDIAAQKLVADFTGHLKLTFSTTAIKEFYLLNTETKQMKKVEAISSSFDAYTYEVGWEEQVWEILEDQKDIGGYLCQKATTNFKGRAYEVWFTTELPFPFGPWKLHGLPGLILEAQDDKGDVKFEYKGFDKIDEEAKRIEIPSYVVKVNKEGIQKLRNVFQWDQSKYYQSLTSSGRMAIGTSYFGIDYSKNTIDLSTDEDYRPSFQTNNPIEIAN